MACFTRSFRKELKQKDYLGQVGKDITVDFTTFDNIFQMDKQKINNITDNYLKEYKIGMNHFEEICFLMEQCLLKTEYYIYKRLCELAVNSNV